VNARKSKEIRKVSKRVYDAMYGKEKGSRIWNFIKIYIIGIMPQRKPSFGGFNRLFKRKKP